MAVGPNRAVVFNDTFCPADRATRTPRKILCAVSSQLAAYVRALSGCLKCWQSARLGTAGHSAGRIAPSCR
jgi:hypothetical protein